SVINPQGTPAVFDDAKAKKGFSAEDASLMMRRANILSAADMWNQSRADLIGKTKGVSAIEALALMSDALHALSSTAAQIGIDAGKLASLAKLSGSLRGANGNLEQIRSILNITGQEDSNRHADQGLKDVHTEINRVNALVAMLRANAQRQLFETQIGLPLGLRIDINTATEKDLQMIPGIGPVLAKAIVSHRVKSGAFITVIELLRVKGIGRSNIMKMMPYIQVEETTAQLAQNASYSSIVLAKTIALFKHLDTAKERTLTVGEIIHTINAMREMLDMAANLSVQERSVFMSALETQAFQYAYTDQWVTMIGLLEKGKVSLSDMMNQINVIDWGQNPQQIREQIGNIVPALGMGGAPEDESTVSEESLAATST
ncbi:MAG: helix-hairpin-helix domain-containing protein, partial [Chlamydiota bacterium]|nr:helix-hairpin-helix domain-containing protein [Chlamydiota bacterium]